VPSLSRLLNRLDHAEGDITPLAEEFAIVVTVMLSLFRGRNRGKGECRMSNECIRIGEAQVGKQRRKGTLGTHVDESGRAQEEMVLLELLRVNNAEISSGTPLNKISDRDGCRGQPSRFGKIFKFNLTT
jgi:hypothetical protein